DRGSTWVALPQAGSYQLTMPLSVPVYARVGGRRGVALAGYGGCVVVGRAAQTAPSRQMPTASNAYAGSNLGRRTEIRPEGREGSTTVWRGRTCPTSLSKVSSELSTMTPAARAACAHTWAATGAPLGARRTTASSTTRSSCGWISPPRQNVLPR